MKTVKKNKKKKTCHDMHLFKVDSPAFTIPSSLLPSVITP